MGALRRSWLRNQQKTQFCFLMISCIFLYHMFIPGEKGLKSLMDIQNFEVQGSQDYPVEMYEKVASHVEAHREKFKAKDKVHNTRVDDNNISEINNPNVNQAVQGILYEKQIAQNKQTKVDVRKSINQQPQLDAHTHEGEGHQYKEMMQMRKERYRRYQNRGKVEGPGEMGKPVVLSEEEKQLAEKRQNKTKQSVNEVASEKVAMDRSVPDFRLKECKSVEYPKDLPTLSTILIFCNEPRSSILRTAHSIVNRTPPDYLAEVILVDDFSDHDELKESLDDYVRTTWPDGIVRIVRRKERGGLIRARMTGAREAKGEVIAIMDGHMEMGEGWSEPILNRIKEKPDTVIVPAIDIIRDATMEYTSGGTYPLTGFLWNLLFVWMAPYEEDLANRKSPTDPIRSPTIMGCAFAVQRKYFFDIGGFDEGMDIWGGENIELPFRVWMCGGSVELLPCSRVGHLYRSSRPYTSAGHGDTLGINGKRLAEVWMDDYKRIFYMRKPGLINADAGDLSERIALRKRLNCHSFRWYLDNIQPDKFIFDENVYGWGRVSNPESNLCIDTMNAFEQSVFPMKLYPCQDKYTPAQLMALSVKNELRLELRCLESNGGEGKPVWARKCHGNGGNQEWKHDRATGIMRHVASGKCLDMVEAKEGGALTVKHCNGASTQKWQLQHYAK